MIDKLGPRVGARKHFLKSQHRDGMNNAHGKLYELCLGDKLLERILVSEGCEEVVAVHYAVDHAVDQAAEGL